MAVFLVGHDEDGAIEPDVLALHRFELRRGLLLVDSALELPPLTTGSNGRGLPARPCWSLRSPASPSSGCPGKGR